MFIQEEKIMIHLIVTLPKEKESVLTPVKKLFLGIAVFLVLCYTISENNLFINKDVVRDQIQEQDLSIRDVVEDENNLIRFTKVKAYGEFGNKKFFVDAHYAFDAEDKKIVRVYKTWPIEESKE